MCIRDRPYAFTLHAFYSYVLQTIFFSFQAEDGIRDAQESRGLGDVYKRQVEPALQARISQIYSFDAPGLNHTVIETDGYQEMASKIKRYIPQGSIVGMMLETPKQAHIVKSVAIGGIAQHDTFSCLLYTSPSPRDS